MPTWLLMEKHSSMSLCKHLHLRTLVNTGGDDALHIMWQTEFASQPSGHVIPQAVDAQALGTQGSVAAEVAASKSVVGRKTDRGLSAGEKNWCSGKNSEKHGITYQLYGAYYFRRCCFQWLGKLQT
jgi:hypothetical protein